MSILTQIISGWPGLFYALMLWMVFHNVCIINHKYLWPAFYYLFPRQRKSKYFKLFPIIQKEQVLNIPSGSRLSTLIPSSGILPENKSNRSEFYALFSGSVKKLGLLFGIFTVLSFGNIQAADISSTATGGNWSVGATWSGGIVPASGDNVTIAAGATVTIDTDVPALSSLAVSGTLQYEATTARTLNVSGIVTINSGGEFLSAPSPSTSVITTHSLVVDGGSIINNGTINFSAAAGAGGTTANASGAVITFKGASPATFNFSTATLTNLKHNNGIVLNKGTSASSVLTFSPGGTFQVESGNTDGFLTINNGTFKIIGTNAFSNPVFELLSYVIPGSGGFELSNPNAVVVGQNGSVDNNGILRISAGIYNIGSSLGNSSVTNNGGTFELSGGEMNVAGRFLLSNAQGLITGGSLNLSTIGHASATQATFQCSLTSKLTISGNPTITFIKPNTNATPFNDIEILDGSGSKSIAGGTFMLGNASTPAGSIFRINSDIPLNNLTIGTNAVAILSDDLTVNQNLLVNGELQVNSNDLVLRKFLPDVVVNFTGGIFNAGATINVTPTNGKHPQNKNTTNYLNHYWTITTSNITNPVVDVTLTYSEVDVVGSDSKIITGVYKPDSKWYKYSPAATALNNLLASGINNTSFSITGITSDPPTVTVTASPATICAGSSSNLTATPVGDNPFIYSWAPVTGLSSSTVANPVATPAATTTYVATVTDANGFTATASQLITVNPLPVATLTSSDGDNNFCAETSVTFTAGGGTNYDFRINGVSVQNGASNTYITSALTNGQTVDVIVSNASGCTATSVGITNTVNLLPTPTLSSSDADNTFCAGTSVTFTAGGGTNYNFRVAGLSVQNGASSTYTTSALTNGQAVDVIVTNASGCMATSTAIVNTVNALPIPTLSSSDSDNIFCAGTSVIFTAGGGINYDFRINSVSVQNGSSSTYVTNTLTNGQTVDVIVTNALGCSVTSSVITNTVNPLPIPTISGSASPCASSTGNIYSTEAGMSGYNWSVSAGGTITSGAGTNSITVTWNIAGSQAVQVNYTNSNGCTSPTATVKNITVNALPNAAITASGSTTFCQGGSVVLTASAGVGYLWNTGATTQSITVNAGGNYSVAVTNASGCSATSAITAVTVNPNPTVVITNPTAVCSPATINLSASAITAGSSSGLTYTYWNDAGATSVLSNYTTVGISGTYYIKGTNGNGCFDMKPVVVTVNQTPTVTTANTVTICSGSLTNIFLNADVPSSSFTWIIGTITGTVTGASAGSASGATPKIDQILTSSGNGGTVQYIVTPTSPAGCVGSPYTITVTVQTPPSIWQQPDDLVEICEQGYATFIAHANGFPTPTVQWQVSTNNGSTWTNLTNGGGTSGATSDILTVLSPDKQHTIDGYKYRAVYTNTSICTPNPVTTNVSTVDVSGDIKIHYPFKIEGCGDGTYTLFIQLQGDQIQKSETADAWAEWYDGTVWAKIPGSDQTLVNGHPTFTFDIQYSDYPPTAMFRIRIMTKKCVLTFDANPLPFGTASQITVANTCVNTPVTFSHNGPSGGTWTINDPNGIAVYTLTNAPGSTLTYTPTGVTGCYTATYATTNPGYCSDTKSFIVFPRSLSDFI